MGDFKLTTVEEFEAATNRLLETGAESGRRCMAVSCKKSDTRTVNLVRRVSAAGSVPWAPAVSPRRHREESADAMLHGIVGT